MIEWAGRWDDSLIKYPSQCFCRVVTRGHVVILYLRWRNKDRWKLYFTDEYGVAFTANLFGNNQLNLHFRHDDIEMAKRMALACVSGYMDSYFQEIVNEQVLGQQASK